MELYDAVVMGAGPAGSTLARTLARKGRRVLLVEKETPGSRRVCGGFAGPEMKDFFSSAELSSQFAAFPKNEIRAVRISGIGSCVLDASFGDKPGWAVDRAIFDAWLAREAVSEGVELSNHSMIVSANKVSGIWELVVGKKNKNRRLGARFFLVTAGRRFPKLPANRNNFFACKTVYENVSTPADRVTLHFVEKGHVGFNPLGNGRVAMCLYVESSYLRPAKGDLDKMMERLKLANAFLGKDMLHAQRVTDWQTCVAEPDDKRIFYRNHTFFAGDALTMVNPIVGGGMSIATASAEILGTLIAKGTSLGFSEKKIASDYEKAWTKRFAKRIDLAASLGVIERSKIFSRLMFLLMGSTPAVFSGLVYHTRKDMILSAA